MNILIALSPILLVGGLAVSIGAAIYFLAKRAKPENRLEQRVAALEEEVRQMKGRGNG